MAKFVKIKDEDLPCPMWLYSNISDLVTLCTPEIVGRAVKAIFSGEPENVDGKPLNMNEYALYAAFLPDLEEAWAKYEQRVKNGAKGGAPKGNQNAQKRKQPYGSIRPHTGPNGTEVEEDTPKGVDSSTRHSRNFRTGEPPLCGGGPLPRFTSPRFTMTRN